jgi:hypothetical protein
MEVNPTALTIKTTTMFYQSKKCGIFFIVLLCMAVKIQAQFTIGAQIRPRAEFRDGVGTLQLKTNDPAFFISQRTRLNANFKSNRVILQASIQDVRVWGQDASTISNADGNKLGLHEAWAEIVLSNKNDSTFKTKPVDYFAIKIGRQELVYDDQRLLGNLDWLQQGRRHDAIVFKLLNKGWQTDLGAAFNQNTDAFNYNGTYYTPANVNPYIKDSKGNLSATPAGFIPLTASSGFSSKSGSPSLQAMPSTNALNQDYKAMQYLYASKSFKQTKISGLFFADHFGKYLLDSAKNISGTDTGYIYGRRFNQKGLNSRITTGLLMNSLLNKSKSLILTAGAYYQTGKDRDGASLSAYTTTLSLSYIRKKFTYSVGWDVLSGNDAFSTSTTNHRFDPLYGTPHKFWGLMDYFYAGTGSPTGGLSNPNFKVKYLSTNKRLTIGLDYHYFALAEDMKDISGSAIEKYLGSEIDLVTNYSLNKFTTVEWGFGLMAASSSMEYAKGIIPGTAKLTGTWSYLTINIRPEFMFK